MLAAPVAYSPIQSDPVAALTPLQLTVTWPPGDVVVGVAVSVIGDPLTVTVPEVARTVLPSLASSARSSTRRGSWASSSCTIRPALRHPAVRVQLGVVEPVDVPVPAGAAGRRRAPPGRRRRRDVRPRHRDRRAVDDAFTRRGGRDVAAPEAAS